MAEAEVITEKVVVTTETQTVQLTLTLEEARTLMTLCYNVGGPDHGGRGVFNEISRALRHTGIIPSDQHRIDKRAFAGSIYFV